MVYNSWHQFLVSNQGKYQNIQQASLAYRFRDIRGASYPEIIKRIPKYATKRILKPEIGGVTEGVEYKWQNSQGTTIRVRFHGIDLKAPEGSNARRGWVARIQLGNRFLDDQGNFHHRNSHNPNSPYYNLNIANNTHIPIQPPTGKL